jgi:hypothetical protein
MITIFTTCLPSSARKGADTMQANAIGSWTWLDPRPEILILGDDEGAADLALRFRCRVIPEVERNEHGTPLLSSMYSLAEKHANPFSQVLCWANSDVIFHQDLATALLKCAGRFERFAMTGSRWREWYEWFPLDFGSRNWRRTLRSCKLGPAAPVCLDYLGFSRGLYLEDAPPPLAVGRFYLNAWFYRSAMQRGVSVVDASDVVMPIHPSHRKRKRQCTEAMENRGTVLAACEGEEIWWTYFPTYGAAHRAAPEKFWHLRQGWRFEEPHDA